MKDFFDVFENLRLSDVFNDEFLKNLDGVFEKKEYKDGKLVNSEKKEFKDGKIVSTSGSTCAIDNSETTILELKKQVENLTKKIAEKDEVIKGLKSDITQKDKIIDKLTEKVRECVNKLERLKEIFD